MNSFQHLNNEEILKQVQDDKSSGLMSIRLIVYDVLGSEITTLLNQRQQPGNYEVTWDAGNQPSGIYFNQLKCGDYAETKKMILLK